MILLLGILSFILLAYGTGSLLVTMLRYHPAAVVCFFLMLLACEEEAGQK